MKSLKTLQNTREGLILYQKRLLWLHEKGEIFDEYGVQIDDKLAELKQQINDVDQSIDIIHAEQTLLHES